MTLPYIGGVAGFSRAEILEYLSNQIAIHTIFVRRHGDVPTAGPVVEVAGCDCGVSTGVEFCEGGFGGLSGFGAFGECADGLWRTGSPESVVEFTCLVFEFVEHYVCYV